MSVVARVFVGDALSSSLIQAFGSGVLLLDEEGGFWLVHSIPGFPTSAAYSWPFQAQKYGQTLLCVSFPFNQFSKIGKWGQGGRVILVPRPDCGTAPHFLLPLPSRQAAELHLPPGV